MAERGNNDSALSKSDHDQTHHRTVKFRLLGGLLSAMTIVGLIFTVVSFYASNHWVADLICQFRLQLALGAAIVFVLLLLLKRWRFALLCLAGCLVNAWPIMPYLLPNSVDDDGAGSSYRLLTINVLTRNRGWDSLIDLIEKEDPDFVVLMEIDSAWVQATRPLSENYPYSEIRPREDNFGIAFLSKHPWSNIEVFQSETLLLPIIDVRFGEGLAAPLRIHATHPIPPIRNDNWAARNEQLFNVVGRLDGNYANIVTGDLNLTPWSPIFQRVCTEGQLTDSALGFGVYPTWSMFPTLLGGLKLDHTLVGEGVSPISHRIGGSVGSDHFPVILDFKLLKN